MKALDNVVDIGFTRLSTRTQEISDTVEAVAAVNGQVQELENDLQFQELVWNSVANSSGILLDRIGSVIGITRNNLSDADYRLFLNAKIIANISDGTEETFIELALVLWPGFVIETRDENYATGVIYFNTTMTDTWAMINKKFSIMLTAKTAGVRLMIEFRGAPEADLFMFDGSGTTQGFDDGGEFLEAIDRSYL